MKRGYDEHVNSKIFRSYSSQLMHTRESPTNVAKGSTNKTNKKMHYKTVIDSHDESDNDIGSEIDAS